MLQGFEIIFQFKKIDMGVKKDRIV